MENHHEDQLNDLVHTQNQNQTQAQAQPQNQMQNQNQNPAQKTPTLTHNFKMSSIESSKFAVVGNVDAGKSTLIGVLSCAKKDNTFGTFIYDPSVNGGTISSILDDGRGSVRTMTTPLKHEKETGRTSNVRFNYIINKAEDPKQITTLVDLCGHEKYLKTTLFGVLGTSVDYGMVIVGANNGIIGMTREHLMILFASKKTFIIVITKIDMAPDNIFRETKSQLVKLLKNKDNTRKLIFFEFDDNPEGKLLDIHYQCIQSLQSGSNLLVPVFCVSSVKGTNINLLRNFILNIHSPNFSEIIKIINNKKIIEASPEEKTLNDVLNCESNVIQNVIQNDTRNVIQNDTLNDISNEVSDNPTSDNQSNGNIISIDEILKNPFAKSFFTVDDQNTLFVLDSCYRKEGIGLILSGTLKRGSMRVGQNLHLGPFNNTFAKIGIKKIENCIRESVEVLRPGESGAISFRIQNKKILFSRSNFHKGQVVIGDLEYAMKHLCVGFKASIEVYVHSTHIRDGYQPVIQCGALRKATHLYIEHCSNNEAIEARNGSNDSGTGSNDNSFGSTNSNSSDETRKKSLVIRSGDKADVSFYFIGLDKYFLESGSYFMFREGKTKGRGTINELLFDIDPNAKIPGSRKKKIFFRTAKNK
jgi:GTPase